MSRVYLSFLGLGSDKGGGKKGYTPAAYELDGAGSRQTEFVQVAEHEILVNKLGLGRFDKTIIVATATSHDLHFERLKGELKAIGPVNIVPVIIDEDMSSAGQWKWFETILAHIDQGDRLTVDLTHGYRAIPIVFSTAINLLQKTKNVILDGLYYAAFDKDPKHPPIVDMKDFCIVNEWAEAVSRLVEDADARKMGKVAEMTPGFQAGELNDPDLVKAFETLTDAIRNVDIHNVADKADHALRMVRQKEATASLTGRTLLGLVLDKFTCLVTGEPVSGRYDRAYFQTQLEIIRLLLKHRLFMQAYTVMREFVASIGLIKVDKARVGCSAGRDCRYRFAEVFVNMLKVSEGEWDFKERTEDKETLLPYYLELKRIGVEGLLRDFTRELVDYRNGFDHAWTSKASAKDDIEEKGDRFFERLEAVFRMLIEKGIL